MRVVPDQVYSIYNRNFYSRDYRQGFGEFIRVLPTDLGIDPERLLPGGAGASGGAGTGGASELPTRAGQPEARITEPQKYGSISNQALSIANADQLVLAKPSTTRVFLAIQNNDTLINLFAAFGGVASTTLGVKIAPGQTLFFDAFVPQDDIHLIADAAGPAAGVIFYANKSEIE